jgi:AraC-like DNA-binding protein
MVSQNNRLTGFILYFWGILIDPENRLLMKLTLQSISHAQLEFTNQLPEDFTGPRLPGGEVLFTKGTFGYLAVQEFDGGNFLMRYWVLKTKQSFTLDAESSHSGVYAVIMMRNEIHPRFDNTDLNIGENQFTILQANRLKTRLDFPPREHFICFEVLVSPPLMQSILNDFPADPFQILEPPPNVSEVLVGPNLGADPEVKEHIRYIFTYSHTETWRRNYFENRAWDIVWKLVAGYLENREEDPLTPQKRKLAYDIQRIILDNLDDHIIIKNLAGQVGVSQSVLKEIFSKAYGMGVHTFRVYERLKKAIQLIHEGMDVNEAALETGWRSADLIRAYYKVYGTTPGTLKKKK